MAVSSKGSAFQGLNAEAERRSMRRIIIIYGHYGCGKTNLALNWAIDLAQKGEKVTIADLDVVNPYFRSGDYTELLDKYGIQVIASDFSHSNLDLPSIPASMYSIFIREGTVIVDVGGDDAGSYALGRFATKIKEFGYEAYYVVNGKRTLTSSPQEAAEILKEIEKASSLPATGVINNTHLQSLTTEKIIEEGIVFAKKTAELLSLPLVATTYPQEYIDKNNIKAEGRLIPVKVLVKPPF